MICLFYRKYVQICFSYLYVNNIIVTLEGKYQEVVAEKIYQYIFIHLKHISCFSESGVQVPNDLLFCLTQKLMFMLP